ncbi:TPA: hypothetical protein ACH3X3_008809 [Trebouxia sp. C0006]
MLTQNTPLAIRPSVSTAFICRSKARHQRRSTLVRARFDTNKGSDRSVLEAFFIGRAFAETVNDRLGAALGDFLSEIAKADAERRQVWKEFESEVQDRAKAALFKSTQSRLPRQKQLPENASLPRTTTNAPIGPVPRTTTGAPTGPVARSRSQPQSSSASQLQLQVSG